MLSGQTCANRNVYPLSPELSNRAADSNGIIHVTWGFGDSNLTQNQQDAIANAIGQWNAFTSSTHVKFEPASNGAIPDLEFKQTDDTSKNGECAAYQWRDARVFFSAGWQARADANPANGATVIAHEIGHYLGLDEAGVAPSQATIMNNPFIGPTTTCQNATVPTTTVQPNDATAAWNCVSQTRPTPTPTPPPPQPTPCLGVTCGSRYELDPDTCGCVYTYQYR